MLRIEDVKIGDTLIVNEPTIFSDLDGGESVMVHSDDDGFLWVFCRDGHHYLDEDVHENLLVGFHFPDSNQQE